MRRSGAIAALALACAAPALASAGHASRPYRQTVDVAVGAGDGRYKGALSWNHVFEWLPRVNAGLGVRLATLRGVGQQRFTTAPKDLVDAGRVHEIRVRDPFTTSANLQVLATVRVFRALHAGFDLDLLGVGFGPSRTAVSTSPDPRLSGPVRSAPPTLDAFLVGARDRGQLDSEFFLAWWATERVVLRAGVSHFVTEYRTRRELDDGNDRFRRSRNLGFVAVGWRLR